MSKGENMLKKKKKISKIVSVLERFLISLIAPFNGRVFRKYYVRHLRKLGVSVKGLPNFISHDCYFDGYDYSLITLGDNITISKEVMLLTHDGSLHTVLNNLSQEKTKNYNNFEEPIVRVGNIPIGNNTFIGARASILPGTNIGDNCLIGACSVVKGDIPSYSIVIGNPGKVIGNTTSYLKE